MAIVVGLVMAGVLVVGAGRAEAARTAADDEAAEPEALVPFPMNAVPDGPTRAPPAFRERTDHGHRASVLGSYYERTLVERARLELTNVTVYDNTWMETSGFPMGDVPSNRGACTDVVVRSLREIGIDLQPLVHQDMKRDLDAYGARRIDYHVDHRRVGTMFTFFTRHAMSLSTDPRDVADFRPGDIVFYTWTWGKSGNPEHVAIVSDKMGPRGMPLLIQNGGPKPVENDSLDHGKILGHFRALPRR